MNLLAQPTPLARLTLPMLGFGTAYTVAVVVGRASRVSGSEISLVWPAAAISVLWVVHAWRLPRTQAVLHMGLLSTLSVVVNLFTGSSLSLALWFLLVNGSLAIITTSVLLRDGRTAELREPVDLARLMFAITCGAVVAAILATAWFAQAGQDSLHQTFALFAVRNGVSALIGMAIYLQIREVRWRRPGRPSVLRVVETLVLTVVSIAVLARVYWFNPGVPLTFLVMLPCLWFSLHYSVFVSTLFVAVTGGNVVLATLAGKAPADLGVGQQALLAQATMAAFTLVVLTLALFRQSRNDLIAELRHRSLHDPLTGLANRDLLERRINEVIETSEPGTVGVILLDLDGFKAVNDAWGHQEGDLLLVEIAQRLRSVVGDDGTVARIGGDEFVVVYPSVASLHEVERCAQRIHAEVERPYGLSADAPYDRISASVGVAISVQHSTARSLVHTADQAMYVAKRNHKQMGSGLKVQVAPCEQ